MARRRWVAAIAAAAALGACGTESGKAAVDERVPAPEATVADHIAERARNIGDPLGVAFIDPDDDVIDFALGDGAVAVEFHDNAVALFDEPLDCAAVTVALDATGTPADVLAAAETAPSGDLSELLVSEYAAVADVLGACGDTTTLGPVVDAAAYQWALVERHLIESGVPR